MFPVPRYNEDSRDSPFVTTLHSTARPNVDDFSCNLNEIFSSRRLLACDLPGMSDVPVNRDAE